ncbi:threonine-phosphate decarboxylase CobD [Alloalcanivorax xenomutans]|uniref:threonine-phosphate decarboxylase CobD n=1 Tax=Alloalcanivorax xenomutans TaxID=1094342 RepID=UPI0006D5BABF|nr:threonine-phosphate decarboxylase CobD [Alloalcanivorax xenomutans]MCE7523372.1 threonine-phosphate decarboxylase CobD [Alloalcanivorax xenomutans]CUR48025.1 L-threonine 3-O-phosphate decarboxylase [Alloalcanivorax xenomutans]
MSRDWERDHGGRRRAAARLWRRPEADWLDLSTGINPNGWPVPPLPPEVWQRLPEPAPELADLARQWVGAPSTATCLAVPGSQAAIQQLPLLRAPCRVGVPVPGYGEHALCWRRAGHQVRGLGSGQVEAALDQLDVLVWINPNNPSGERLPPERLLAWCRRLADRGGWLVVDEAFLDDPALSVATDTGTPGLVVLRSLGKVFGLAGVRAGWVFAEAALLERLARTLGPWSLSGPAQAVMAGALADHAWQRENRTERRRAARRLATLLERAGLAVAGGTDLFLYCPHSRATVLADALARQGILVRDFVEPPALRIGLPPDEAGAWKRLEQALAAPAVREIIDPPRPD